MSKTTITQYVCDYENEIEVCERSLDIPTHLESFAAGTRFGEAGWHFTYKGEHFADARGGWS